MDQTGKFDPRRRRWRNRKCDANLLEFSKMTDRKGSSFIMTHFFPIMKTLMCSQRFFSRYTAATATELKRQAKCDV